MIDERVGVTLVEASVPDAIRIHDGVGPVEARPQTPTSGYTRGLSSYEKLALHGRNDGVTSAFPARRLSARDVVRTNK